MTYLIIFICGFVFASVISPLLDSFTSWCATMFEVPKGKCAVKIAKQQEEINKLTDPPAHQIGFCIPDEPEYYEDEDEEYDD